MPICKASLHFLQKSGWQICKWHPAAPNPGWPTVVRSSGLAVRNDLTTVYLATISVTYFSCVP